MTTDVLPSITSHAYWVGNTPPLRLAKMVRSVGALVRYMRTAPSPLAETPWQLAQRARYSFLPKSTLVCAKLVLLTTASATKRPGNDAADCFMICLLKMKNP